MSALPIVKVHRPEPAPPPAPEPQPWDALWLALEVKADAERDGDAATAGECDVLLDHLRHRLGMIGGLIVLHAIESGGDVVRKRLARAVTHDLAACWGVARQAAEQCRRTAEETQVLRDEVRALRREVDRLGAVDGKSL